MKYFKGYKVKSVAAVLAKLVEAVFELILPLLMARLIDEGITQGNMSVVYWMVFWMFVLTLLGYVSSLVCQYLASVVSQRVGGRLRSALFAKINTFSIAEYNHYSSALLTNRITTDVNLIQEMIARTIRLGVRAPILMIGSLFALNAISPRLAMALLKTFPIFVIVVVAFMYFSMRGHKKATQQLDTVVAKVRESLSGTRIIRAFSKQEESDTLFNEENKVLAKKQRNVGWITTLSGPMTSLIMNLVLVWLVYLGALEIQIGTMTQGQTIAVINYCTQLVLTLIVAMNLVMIFSRGYTSSFRVKEILDTEVSVKNTGSKIIDAPFDLEFKNVSFSYPQETRRVINDVSFSVKPGQVLGIIGLTGSGKSTLVKLIPRFADVSSGVIEIDGTPIQDYDLVSLRNAIGYVSQSAEFLKASIADNVLMKSSLGNAEDAIIDAQGKDILNKGIESTVEEGGKNLSGGQRQRLSIARALAKNPRLIVFDDSFSALDFLTDKNLRMHLKEAYNDASQIIISQRTTSVMDADTIFVLDDGRIQDMGTHDYLMEHNEVYRRIHRIQTEGGAEDVQA
ncbi:ABC transporter ATP-binding protein [Erysipelothrix sp. HDW6C]|uniref:ABC transporter ATP-binding protein n=1 Tax=Erysipelothrix sp. HDW6C TaxID=2714930 RepID=UPI00140D70EF|nr:ABC transporter ATP-binding protein [Erysipelothrix sp. HDW6C]QIK69345.1 ABC transporter ATP-binding protein [Erysipelothrix sp. HDW6C]